MEEVREVEISRVSMLAGRTVTKTVFTYDFQINSL